MKAHKDSGGGIAIPKRGDIIEIAKQQYAQNPRPRKLGNLYCFLYSAKNEPWIVVGPDWLYSVLEMILCNVILGTIIGVALYFDNKEMWKIGTGILTFHNLIFPLTVLYNQGLPSRNPQIHSKGYLNKVKIRHQDKYCKKCKLVHKENSEAEHCTFCDYCVVNLDHHCPWSSKCIGKGNMVFFKLYLGAILACLVFAMTGGLLTLSTAFKGNKSVKMHSENWYRQNNHLDDKNGRFLHFENEPF